MAMTDDLKNSFNQMITQMKEQEWYQQLEGTYQQLSTDQQNYVKWGSVSAVLIFAIYSTLNVVSSTNTVKSEYFEKNELVQSLNQAGDEIKRLKGQSSGLAPGSTADWKKALQNIVSTQGLQNESVEILKESPGASQTIIQETLIEAKIKNVHIGPLVQILFQIEHSQPPMKLKGMLIETEAADGLLTAKLNLSGYYSKAEKK